MTDSAPVASASVEIRAPRAHVRAFCDRAKVAAQWVWAPAQVGEVSSERELADGSWQRVNGLGDKLKDRVGEVSDDRVTVRSEWLPKEKGVPGRSVELRILLENRAGTTRATAEVHVAGKAGSKDPAEQRRWRRHAEQCLARLQGLAEAELGTTASEHDGE